MHSSKNRITHTREDGLYLKSLRMLSGERRMEITSELFETVKEIAKAGIIHQNPGISEEELEKALRKRVYG